MNANADNYFINDADLGASRPPPRKEGIQLENILRNPTYVRYVGIAYVVLVLIIWVNIRYDVMPNASNAAEGAVLGFLAALPFFILTLIRGEQTRRRYNIPPYRNLVFIRDAIQVSFLFFALLSLYVMAENLQDNLERSNLGINFSFLERTFGTEVSEGPDPNSDMGFWGDIPVPDGSLTRWTTLKETDHFEPDTYTRALITGFINTLRVVFISLAGTTVLGVLIGIGLLSNNWLVRNVSMVYVEVFRNTPLLVQIFFIYQLLLAILPSGEGIELPGNIFLNLKGINYPLITTSDTFIWFLIPVAYGVIRGVILWRWRLRIQDKTGQPARTVRWFLASLAIPFVAGIVLAFVASGSPFSIENPKWITSGTGFSKIEQFEGGARFSLEYLSLALSLILYTAAFIADIVRAGIQSVPKGQIEAARAAGLSGGQTLRLIVLPQAMRLIVPPLNNQYLNLAKNSSLGLVIGFFDLYGVANVAQNQSGQAVAIIIVVMITYLGLSLFISSFMNLFNSSLSLKTR